MKTIALLLLTLACSGCASSQFNHTYSNSSVPNASDYGLPESPHTF